MRPLLLFALIGAMVGCAKPQPTVPRQNKPQQRPQVVASAHWKFTKANGCCEEYDRCIDDNTGRVIIEVMHGATSWDGPDPSDPFGVYENGAGFGEYLTRDKAKTAATNRHPECGGAQ